MREERNDAFVARFPAFNHDAYTSFHVVDKKKKLVKVRKQTSFRSLKCVPFLPLSSEV